MKHEVAYVLGQLQDKTASAVVHLLASIFSFPTLPNIPILVGIKAAFYVQVCDKCVGIKHHSHHRGLKNLYLHGYLAFVFNLYVLNYLMALYPGI